MNIRSRTSCIYRHYDGAGTYCRLYWDTSGWHKYYRTECFCDFGELTCVMKRNRLDKEKIPRTKEVLIKRTSGELKGLIFPYCVSECKFVELMGIGECESVEECRWKFKGGNHVSNTRNKSY